MKVKEGVRRYGAWAGDPQGVAEDPTRCIEEVWPNDRANIPHQCQRQRGHGEGGLYCRQHATAGERQAKRAAEYDARQAAEQAIRQEAMALQQALGVGVKAYYAAHLRKPTYVRVGLVDFDDLRKIAAALGKEVAAGGSGGEGAA